MKKFPVVFTGHGSPMIALEKNGITDNFNKVGKEIIDKFGKPKAILSISAHWYTRGTYIQKAMPPRQIYDMYGFPEELYKLRYDVSGLNELSDEVINILGNDVKVNDDWGIDHGTWSVLIHMFPEADIPVVQLSINAYLSFEESYELSSKLKVLREKGYLIFGSGNIVHNLRLVEWGNEGGTPMAIDFNDYVVEALKVRNDKAILEYKNNPNGVYAVNSGDHYLPLIYALGASDEVPYIFNNICNLGSISMTSLVFGL